MKQSNIQQLVKRYDVTAKSVLGAARKIGAIEGYRLRYTLAVTLWPLATNSPV